MFRRGAAPKESINHTHLPSLQWRQEPGASGLFSETAAGRLPYFM
jgi:hypothetical protein